MKQKVDFLHIGYHKTASTWFQLNGYPMHPEINLLNQGSLDPVFYETFVQPDEFNFDMEVFKTNFWEQANRGKKKTVLFGICEESLSGNFWTGRNSDTLLHRINNQFSGSKIILAIRRQDSMLLSLYSNYVKNGGSMPFSRLIKDIPFEGALLGSKLEYHKLIQKYYDYFGMDNVFVYLFEEFTSSPQTVLRNIANFLDVSDFPDTPTKKRVNIKMGCYQLGTARILNSLSFNNRYSRKILSSIFQTDKKLSLQIPDNLTELWSLSNQNTKLITGLNLEKYSYPMVNS